MANNLKFIRNRLGLSQDRAAELMGTTRNQIAKLESGSRRLSSEWINRAAKAFGVDPGDLVTDNPLTAANPPSPINSDIAPYLRPILEKLFESFGQDKTQAQSWTRVVISATAAAQAVGVVPSENEARALDSSDVKYSISNSTAETIATFKPVIASASLIKI